MTTCFFMIMGVCTFAACTLVAEQAKESPEMLKGGDISMLPRFEELGSVYRDNGKPADAIGTMMRHGCNCFRLRLFVNPTMKNAVIQDLDYTIKLAKRIKKAGAVLLLDLHYSDTWADPGKQGKPAIWKDLTFPELEAKVESYTADVILSMKKAGCLPDIVQVGNEITPGFLWPDGQIAAKEGGWENFSTLLKAGIRGVKKTLSAADNVRIMIHIDKGGDAAVTRGFFQKLDKHKVEYDIIGLSYYPFWHGSITDLRKNLNETAQQFKKEIVVVETAYPSNKDDGIKNMAWPQTHQGQKQFLHDVIAAVHSTPNGLGTGVIWWYPESILNKKLHVWMNGRMALFDSNGNPLPALDEFRGE